MAATAQANYKVDSILIQLRHLAIQESNNKSLNQNLIPSRINKQLRMLTLNTFTSLFISKVFIAIIIHIQYQLM
jgi:hypothetical protein